MTPRNTRSGWGALALLIVLLGIALSVFVVELLRASVLPVVPFVLAFVGFAWHLWQEVAVDAGHSARRMAST